MKVKKVKLRNILGVREFELDADGKINVISGANGSGKSSVLAGLRTMIGGGNPATLRGGEGPGGEPGLGVGGPTTRPEPPQGSFAIPRRGGEVVPRPPQNLARLCEVHWG